jgi:hypothetical protein
METAEIVAVSAADYALVRERALAANPRFDQTRPTEQQISDAIAVAFYEAHPAELRDLGVVRLERSNIYGASVMWDADGRSNMIGQNGLDADFYLEEQIFFVNDDPYPDCSRVREGVMRCTFGLHVVTDKKDFVGDLATSLGRALATNTLPQEQRYKPWTDPYAASGAWKAGFKWQPMTVVLHQADGQWRSPELVGEMRKVVASLSETRDRMTAARSRSVDAFAQGVRDANTCLGYALANATEYAPSDLDC